MFWKPRKPSGPRYARPPWVDPWRPTGEPPKVGEAARVVFSDGREHARGWVVATLPCGDVFICDPEPGHKDEPWIAEWPPHQVEALLDAPAYPHEIITSTDDGLTPGARVRVYIRARDEWAKGRFVAETLGRRLVYHPGGGATSYPAEDVLSTGVTVDAVKAMRNKLGISLSESKRVLKGRALKADLALADDVEDLKPVLEALLNHAYPDLHPSELEHEKRLSAEER